MKELSIEEKAKRYDEALERARQFSEKPYLEDSKGIVDYIFPELKESEDEKIRKEMIFYFTEEIPQCSIREHADKMKEYIAWLEKQDEQKPADKVEPIVIRDFYSVFSREQVEEIDKRIEESQRLYNAKLRDAMRKVEDFPMTD